MARASDSWRGGSGCGVSVFWIAYSWTHRYAADTRVPTVLGGASWSVTDWPWVVSIFTADQFICNGTLIAPELFCRPPIVLIKETDRL